MEIDPQIVERISRKVIDMGGVASEAKIRSKLNLLINDLNIPEDEAERMVTSESLKEVLKNSAPGSQNAEFGKIADANPGDWVNVVGKVVSLSTPVSPAMSQTGIIADDSGAIRFVVWAKANAPTLELGSWYRLESATVDEYRGSPSMKIHSGTRIEEVDEVCTLIPQPVPISGIKPGIATVRVKVVQNWEPRHDRMMQTGMVGDETGSVKFVTWKDDGSTAVEEGKVYTIYYAGVDEYQGRLSLNFTGATILEEEGASLDVADGSTTVFGAFLNMGPGSGVIKRCPVEGCTRVLNRQNYCPDHEVQTDFRYDLRVTGVLDDGVSARNILMQREVVEAVTGITLDKAVEIVQSSPLGLDDVVDKLKEVMMGRYFRCRGSNLDGTILVSSCEFVDYDSEKHAALINRASESVEVLQSAASDAQGGKD
ncbi:MAG: nucleotide-binding protein [Methanomicrobium sp.]|nr:nucleotide-binding protein [Methanomicrobium sp.]